MESRAFNLGVLSVWGPYISRIFAGVRKTSTKSLVFLGAIQIFFYFLFPLFYYFFYVLFIFLFFFLFDLTTFHDILPLYDSPG